MTAEIRPKNLRSGGVFRAAAVPLILFSLLVQLAALVLNAGYWSSQGQVGMQGINGGFDGPLNYDHVVHLIGQASAIDFFQSMSPIEAAVLLAHLLAIALVFSRKTSGFLVVTFCVAQLIALLWGAMGLPLMFSEFGQVWTGEMIVEGSLSTIVASGVWLVVSCVLGTWYAIANKLWLFFRPEHIPEQTV